jgi:sulfonate transport system ATP-binding protein
MTVNIAATIPDSVVRGSTAGAAIHLSDVRKTFGTHEVLRGISLDIPPGQFVAIVGRSGCGKSTLLRLLAGLDAPSGGQITLDNATSKTVRLMFQEPRLLPWQRIAANVEIGLPQGTGRKRQAKEALSQVGLAGRETAWPAILSGGQKQRVALARALVSNPAILALDEPLGALDALTRIEMQALIEQVWLDRGFTALVVTHDVSEAVTLADRILLLDAGQVAMDVTVDLPRPRRHGNPEAAAIEGRILERLLTH